MVTIIAVLVALPIIIMPVAFVWYLNVTGIYAVLKDKAAKKTRRIAKLHTIKI